MVTHEVGMVKPGPRGYALPCSRLGVWPGEAVLLDDQEPYVAGAREAGMHAVWFRGDNALAIAEITGLSRGLQRRVQGQKQCVSREPRRWQGEKTR